MAVTLAPLQPTAVKEYGLDLVLIIGYAHGRYLIVKTTHFDGGDNDDRHHAKSCRSSC